MLKRFNMIMAVVCFLVIAIDWFYGADSISYRHLILGTLLLIVSIKTKSKRRKI